jgi:hypothetical protein
VGNLHVTRRGLTGLGANLEGWEWTVTFEDAAEHAGNVAELVANGTGSLLGAGAGVSVSEFVEGVANRFTIEPKKASGAPIKDLTAASGFGGGDVFFTEMLHAGSGEWAGDGGVAVYNPVQYDVQNVALSLSSAGSITGVFQLRMDTSAQKTGGTVQTTGNIDSTSATTAKGLQRALELLTNVRPSRAPSPWAARP